MYHSPKNFRILDELVRKHIHCCASHLVAHLAANPDSLIGSGYDYEDDLMAICQQPDYEGSCDSAGIILYTTTGGDTFAYHPDDVPSYVHEEGTSAFEQWLKSEEDGHMAMIVDPDDPDWEDIAQEFMVDIECYHDALEHWIVDDWFGDMLKVRGEMVGEILGICLWGRCCSGQSMAMDSVIYKIADSMGILEGGPNEWEA